MFSKISFSDIGSYLPADSVLVCHNSDAAICGVRHFTAGEEYYSNDYLYICTGEEYNASAHKQVQNTIVCAPDHSWVEHMCTRGNLIAVFCLEDLYRVTTSILNDLSSGARIGAAGLKMQNLSLRKNPVEDIINYVHNELGNPVILTDSSFVVVAKAGLEDISDEPQWNFVESNGAFPPEFTGNIIHSKSGLRGKDAPLIDDRAILGMKHRQATARVIFKGKTIGYLLVLELNRPFDDYTLEFIPMAADFFAHCLNHSNGRLLLSSSFHEDFLISILSEAITSPEEILMSQENFGIRLKPHLFLITIDLPLATIDSDKVYAFTSKLRLLFGKDSIVSYENSIVVLYDDDQIPLFDSISRDAFETLLEEYGCKANISAPFDHLHQTRRHYMQTKMCATIRNMLHLDKTIVDYQTEVAEYHMIFNYSRVQNLDNLLHPAVFMLRALDRENGTDRLDTLFAYTDHLCNLRTTASDLYLHYNTLKYRIDKIAALTNINFEDPSEVYRISLSKKVLQIEEALNEI